MDPPKSPADPTFSIGDLYPLAVAHKFFSVSRLHEATLRVAAAAAATGTPFRPAAVAEALGFGPVNAAGEPLVPCGETGGAKFTVNAGSNFFEHNSDPKFSVDDAGSDPKVPLSSFFEPDSDPKVPLSAFFQPQISVSTGSWRPCSSSAPPCAGMFYTVSRQPAYKRSSAALYSTAADAAGGAGRGAGGGGASRGGGGCPHGARIPDAATDVERRLFQRIEDVRGEALLRHTENRLLILKNADQLNVAKVSYEDALSKAKLQVGVMGFRMFAAFGCFSFLSMVYYIKEFGKHSQAPNPEA